MIVLTSTEKKNQELAKRFAGFDFYSFPCIEYKDTSDDYKALDAAIRANHTYEWVFFLSAKAAEVFFERKILFVPLEGHHRSQV